MPYPVERIRHVDDHGLSSHTFYPVLIIGAGESGIAMGCRLQKDMGFDQFRIFERKSGLGGTWHANRYPGIACDVPAIFYSFSFAQNAAWTGPFPSGREIVQYLYNVCAKFKILDKIQLNTSVKSVTWMDKDDEWEVVLDHLIPGLGDSSTEERNQFEKQKGLESAVLQTETVRAKIVVSAVGGLVEPKDAIEVPGIDSFEGEVVHTARWKPDLDLRDKNVVVVGTGCSAGQVVPQLVKPQHGAKHVTQLMRSPPWTVPFLPPEGIEAWKKWMPRLCTYVPGFQLMIRYLMFSLSELEFILLFTPNEASRARRSAKAKELLRYLHKSIPEKYHEIMTPDYEVFCKRRVIDDGWFDSLNNPNIELTSQPLTKVSPKSVTIGPGRYYPPMEKSDSKAPTAERTIPADVLIMANGYKTNKWLHPLDVTGRNGRSLYKTWDERGGAQAYLGCAMDGFPNFFIIFGPNTATGHTSVILASENMVSYSLHFMKPILNGDVNTYEVKESAERAYTRVLQDELRKGVFASGCHSWYVDPKTGWNATTYPRTQIDFGLRCLFPNYKHWIVQYTRKGLLKHRLSLILRAFTVLSVLAGFWYRSRSVTLLKQARQILKDGLKSLVERL